MISSGILFSQGNLKYQLGGMEGSFRLWIWKKCSLIQPFMDYYNTQMNNVYNVYTVTYISRKRESTLQI